MFTEAHKNTLLRVIADYQENSQLADLSGQADKWINENAHIETEAIAAIIDSIGANISNDLAEHLAIHHFGVSEEDAESWTEEHLGNETTMRLWTGIGQQVASHTFLIGVMYGQAIAKIPEEAASGRD